MNKGPSVPKVPKEGPSVASMPKHGLSVRRRPYVGPDLAKDEIVEKVGNRKSGNCADKGKGKAKLLVILVVFQLMIVEPMV
uniref:Uncharacterized protein n=1 Tax=Tanacetum cinerariifolium TaxID=118510 RepID=A0A6L2P2K4_TANCI|nr:hypothetical protein [Tanacetum cinerariifolium]